MKKYIQLFFFISASLYSQNVGHRLGGDIYTPENTLYAYEKLWFNFKNDANLTHIECDIQESLDGKLIIFHDAKIARIVPKINMNLKILKKTLGNKKFDNINIRDLKWSAIKKLQLSHNAKIPTLKQMLDASVKWKVTTPIHLEIKSLQSDEARMKLIKLIVSYQKKLDIFVVIFSSNFYKSFPFTKKWIRLFRKNNIVVRPLGKYDFSKIPFSIVKKTFYKVILKETPFYINTEKKRKIDFPVELSQYKNINKIFIGIFNGADDSGDKGLHWKLKIKNSDKVLDFNFSKSLHWDWFEVDVLHYKTLILSVEDYDTTLKGKRRGNYGMIKVIGELKP
ncbi:MAG: hypothetical protein L3J43_01145 [Sulfurovum sp.]|nr:hypothetical protein [Sulfurovum sp.]